MNVFYYRILQGNLRKFMEQNGFKWRKKGIYTIYDRDDYTCIMFINKEYAFVRFYIIVTGLTTVKDTSKYDDNYYKNVLAKIQEKIIKL